MPSKALLTTFNIHPADSRCNCALGFVDIHFKAGGLSDRSQA